MLHRLPYILTTLLITQMFVGCQRHSSAWADLIATQNMIEVNPDSAFLLVTTIDPQHLKNKEEEALYGLLMTQALVKNGYTVTDDSLIEASYQFYSSCGNSSNLMKSEFYRAEVAHNNFDLTKAVKSLMNAHALSVEIRDEYWRAKISELMGDVCASAYNRTEWKKFTLEAVASYKKAGMELNHRYALCDYAWILGHEGFSDKATVLLDSVSLLAVEDCDTALLSYAYQTLYPILVRSESYAKADTCLNSIFAIKDTVDINPYIFVNKAVACINTGGAQSAETYIALADSLATTNSDRASLLTVIRDYHKYMGQFEKALLYSDSALLLQNSEVERVLQESVITAQRDYYDGLNQRAKFNMMQILWVAASIIIIGMFMYWFTIRLYRRRINTLRLEITNHMEDVKNLCLILARKDTETKAVTKDLQERLESIFRESWSLLNLFCDEYFEKGESEKTRKTIVKHMDIQLSKLKEQENLNKILENIDNNMDQVVTRMRCCGFLSQNDIVFLSLIIAGFSPRTVCWFTDIKLKYYYVRRSRLIDRIDKSDSPDRELLLLKIKM